jgi:hypothetical protein
MKYCIRYICSALVVAGTLTASFALAEERSASEKSDPKMEEMRFLDERSQSTGCIPLEEIEAEIEQELAVQRRPA